MKKTLLKELAEKIAEQDRADPHLSIEELRSAVFEEPFERSDHLNRCTICSNTVAQEQERNPLYLLMKQAEREGTPKEEFWAGMDEILRQIREESDD